MPLDYLVAGAAPVPGYELLQPLGGTAFSSAWSVRAPDGTTRMWKIIDLAVANTALETRNLELLVRLKHPSLNPLVNYHTLAERRSLILETAAPLKSLRDRLKECKYYSPPALPVHELVPWMTSVAEGLDFLNAPQHEFQGKKAAIYHRELKPENMLLFREGNAVVCKVGDFGLAKPVSDHSAQHSQGLQNYDYDPPEFYEGSSSASCDQYSLAIACYELRTGSLPFSGSMLEQLSSRLNDTPNLSALESDAEQETIRRALRKHPAQRYGSCSEFVAAWTSAMLEAEATKNAPTQESPSVRMRRAQPRGANGALASMPAAMPSAVAPTLRATPKLNRFDLPAPVLLAPSNGPGSAMKRLPAKPKPIGVDDNLTPSQEEFFIGPSIPTSMGGENGVSQIIKRAKEAQAQAEAENAPQEGGLTRSRRNEGMAKPIAELVEEPQVPMAWVYIISMVVLGAIAIVAKELVSRQV